MRLSPASAASLVLVALAGCDKPAPSHPTAELIVVGKVVTLDEHGDAQAVGVLGGRIAYVGDAEGAMRLRGPDTVVQQLPAGATVYPGFTDAHMHLAGVGLRELTLNLEGTTTKDAFLAKVAAAAEAAEPGGWIVGRGWIETHWSPPEFPTRADLDRVAPRNPTWLVRADGHAGVANSAALERAGITRKTQAPASGRILRDAEGEPNGMLIDDAQALMTKVVPEDGGIDPTRALEAGIAREAALGWTGVQDAGVDGATLERLRALCAAGKLAIRWYGALDAPSAAAAALIEAGPQPPECEGRITLRALKFYMDGAVGSRGAALLAPYADAPQETGLFRNDPAVLAGWYARALRAGVQVETHAIGDRGNRQVLDLYRDAFATVKAPERAVQSPRWRIEHAQVLDAADVPRFAALGVIPSMQPSHAISDLFFAPKRLGMARLAHAYAWRELIDSGVPLPAGSDAPVEQGDPRIEFYAAVARKSLDGQQLEGWHPELAMTRLEALRSLTEWPAYAAFEEEERGRIVVGMRADLTAFDRDLLTVPEAEILTAKPLLTVVGGEVVHAAD